MTVPIIIRKEKGLIIIDKGNIFTLKAPLFSLDKFHKLRNKSLVIGYVGARGAGKSVNAARDVAINHMMRGKKVWSNMDIEFVFREPGKNEVLLQTERFSKLKLKDLDEVYTDGCIYVDEINMEMAEARRAMGNENLTTNYIVQQLRKRRLNFIWSAQSEMHVDSRLRWQTDIFIKCIDKSKPNGPGELTELKCYDYSGVLLGKSPNSQKEAEFAKTTILNKPWWNIYNTWQLQGIDDEEETEENEERKEAAEIARQMFEYMKLEAPRIEPSKLWKMWKIKDHKMKIYIGEQLRELGVRRAGMGRAYYSIEKELIEA